MAWETRGGNRYYYRKRRINGRVISEYLGRRDWVEAAAKLVTVDRLKRELDRLDFQEQQQEQADLDRQTENVCFEIQAITRAVLLVTGHYQHKGQWRKRRVSERKLTSDEALSKFNALLKTCNKEKPKQADVEALRQVIKEYPNITRVLNMATQAVDHLLGKMSATVSVKELLSARLELLEKDLGYAQATPLEQLLIWQVCLCWLRLALFERYYTNTTDNTTLTKAAHYEKRLSATQARFLRAIETLARVRRLARKTPEVLQVNIGAQQINQVNAGNESKSVEI